MSHNLVSEIKKTLTHAKICTQIAFHQDMTSKIQICLSIPVVTQEPLAWLHSNLISTSRLAGEPICRGKSPQVEQVSHCEGVMNHAPWQVQDRVYSCWTAASQNVTWHDYLLIEKSLVAFVIFPGQCQDTPSAIQMLSVQVPLHPLPFVDSRLPELSIRMCHTACLSHGDSLLHPPILVVTIHQGSPASAVTSPCAAELFWWFSPSPSQVCHLRLAGPALSLHHSHLPHPPYRQNLHDHSDCLW